MKLLKPLIVLLVSFSCVLADEGRDVETLPPDKKVSFTKDVLPALQRNCLACHNKSETEGELILESVQSVLDGGDSGPAIIPGDAEESLLFQVATHVTEPIMPPLDNDVGAKPLSPRQLGLLKSWIDQGAKPDEESGTDAIKWRKVPESYAQVFALEVSPNGRWVAAGRGNELLVYSVAAKRETQRLVDAEIASTHPDSAHLDVVQAIAWSPDHRTLVSSGYRCIKVWQRDAPASVDSDPTSSDQQLVAKWVDAEQAFVLSPDKSRVIALSKDNTTAQLLDVATGKSIKQIVPAVFSQDELASLDRRSSLAAERLRVAKADVATAKKRKEDDEKNAKKTEDELKKAKEEVPKKQEVMKKAAEDQAKKEKELADLNQKLASKKAAVDEAGEDEKKQIQDEIKNLESQVKAKKDQVDKAVAAAKKRVQEFEGSEKVVELAKQAIARAKKAVELRAQELSSAEQEEDKFAKVADQAKQTADDARNAKPSIVFEEVTALDQDFVFGIVSASGELATFSWSTGELVDVYSANAEVGGAWKLVKTIGYPDLDSPFVDRVTSLAFSHDGGLLATGGGEPSRTGELLLWDTSNWTNVSIVKDAHSDVVYDLQFSPQDGTLASCASDRMMKTIDVASAKPIRNFEGHTGHVMGVTWRADGRTLATAGADKVVKVWDAKEGTQKKTVSGFKSEVTAVRFLGVEDRFVFSMGDGKVESRDSAGNGKPAFSGFTDYVHRVSTSVDGRVVAAAGQDRVIRIWDAAGKSLATLK